MVQVTALYGALSAVLLIVLTFRVIARRRSARIGIGDGGDAILARRIRVHGNAAEFLPIGLLLLLLCELGGLRPEWLHAFGATLLVGRLLHAHGLSGSIGTSFGRFGGMLLTLIVLLAMGITLLVQSMSGIQSMTG